MTNKYFKTREDLQMEIDILREDLENSRYFSNELVKENQKLYEEKQNYKEWLQCIIFTIVFVLVMLTLFYFKF